LLQVGTVLHKARSGRLVIKLSKEVKPGIPVYDGGKRKLGRVVELMGPVKAPYASVAVVSSRSGKPGDPVYSEG
jgi:RNA-binding protein